MVKKVLAKLRWINKSRSLAVAIFLSIFSLGLLSLLMVPQEKETAPTSQDSQLFAKEEAGVQLPSLLSLRDEKLYRDIFALQKDGKWQLADALIEQLSDKKLLGHVLAERYLQGDYRSNSSLLTAWLEKYGDHPQAGRIYALAVKKDPTLARRLATIDKQKLLENYGADNGLARWKSESHFASDWDRALEAWRSKNYSQAAQQFSKLAKQDGLHEWKIAASSFWAWRAYTALGSRQEAAQHLYVAAGYPRTFYGILARQKLALPLDLDKFPEMLSDSDVLEVMAEDAIRRVIALSHVGETDLADGEMRQLFFKVPPEEKHRLLTIANELNLASVQMAMAWRMATEERQLDFASYPIPEWQPYSGFRVEPALIYAMARQESGFRNHAVSPAGALGVMQLMPDTVSRMKKRNSFIANASEPAANITLGQSYIEHLLDTSMVGNNLLYMLTAYNAGPGRLQKWKKTIQYKGDPLLFLESIPFGETRSYVMQVMTNYWIYSDLMGNPTRSHQALLKNQWPTYERPLVMASAG